MMSASEMQRTSTQSSIRLAVHQTQDSVNVNTATEVPGLPQEAGEHHSLTREADGSNERHVWYSNSPEYIDVSPKLLARNHATPSY